MTRAWQDGFAAALHDPARPVPDGLGAQRFAVYRNNVAVALGDALAECFPAVASLVGPAFFAAMAREFARAHPPRGPVIAEWGADLPGWLAGFAPAASLPYLPDMARLEQLTRAAANAADAPPLDPADATPDMRPRPHPACRWLASRWPLGAIRATALPDAQPVQGVGPDIVVTRPRMAVHLYAAPAGTAACLESSASGAALDRALAGADDPAVTLTVLLASGALVS